MNASIFGQVLSRMVEYNAPDMMLINHAMKVYSFTQVICGGEKVDEDVQLIAGLSGILHDIGIREAERKYQSSAWNYQELEGPAIAKDLLQSIDISATTLDRVLYIIGNHHSYAKIDGIDFQILVEADFFVNIDEDGPKKRSRLELAKKVFSTATGKELLERLYGNDEA